MSSRQFHLQHIAGLMVLLLLTGLVSCGRQVTYSQFRSVSPSEWHADSLVRFDYRITDAPGDYQMIVYIRHTDRYPYQNMWLFVDEGVRRDTIEFYLADDRGRWLGDKHHGFIEMPVLLEEHCHFPDTGAYRLTVQHGMRDSLLRGITDVGVEIIEN